MESGHNKKISSRGFTLVEVMTALAIVSVTTGLAVSNFRDTVAPNPVGYASSNLTTAALSARVEAVKRGESVRVSALDPGDDRNEWGPGLVVYADKDGSRTFTAGDEKIKILKASAGTTINGPDGVRGFDFLSSGAVNIGAVSFQICDGANGAAGRTITLTGSGQLHNANSACR